MKNVLAFIYVLFIYVFANRPLCRNIKAGHAENRTPLVVDITFVSNVIINNVS